MLQEGPAATIVVIRDVGHFSVADMYSSTVGWFVQWLQKTKHGQGKT